MLGEFQRLAETYKNSNIPRQDAKDIIINIYKMSQSELVQARYNSTVTDDDLNYVLDIAMDAINYPTSAAGAGGQGGGGGQPPASPAPAPAGGRQPYPGLRGFVQRLRREGVSPYNEERTDVNKERTEKMNKIQELLDEGIIDGKRAEQLVNEVNKKYPMTDYSVAAPFKKYVPFSGGSARAYGRFARRPFMGRISNASSGWEPGRMAMLEPNVRSKLNKARKTLQELSKKVFDEEMREFRDKSNKLRAEYAKAKTEFENILTTVQNNLKDKNDALADLANLGKGGNPLGAASDIVGHLGKDKVSNNGKEILISTLFKYCAAQYAKAKQEVANFDEAILAHGIEGTIERVGAKLKEDYRFEGDAAALFDKDVEYLKGFYKSMERGKIVRGLAKFRMSIHNISMGAMTWGDVWLNFWYNIRDLIFGPWVWGTLLVVLQWLFVGNFIQIQVPNALYFVAPIGIGALTLMFNIQGSGKPWDWLTHFVSGMLIGFSAIIMAVTVITPEDMGGWESRQWFTFWFIWGGATVFLGIFSFYQSGGFLFVFQLSILILLFGWLALGPYRAVYADIIDSIRAPIRFVWDSFRSAFEDVWLLASNPQEYFARQQLKNVRTVSSISLPDGVEISAIDIEPLNPALSTKGENDSQSFTVSAEIRNKGIGDAKNVRVWVGCDSFCENESIIKEGYRNGFVDLAKDGIISIGMGVGKIADSTLVQAIRDIDLFWLANPKEDVEATAQDAVEIADGLITFFPNMINKINERFKNVQGHVEKYAELKKSDAQLASFPGLVSYEIDPKSKAYLITATATVYAEYDYATSSSLSVQVASEDEYKRVLRDGTLNPVVARGAKTPAQISLSVGRQPLKSGGEYELIVSIINTRSDGHVFLYGDKSKSPTPIVIKLPASVGNNLVCAKKIHATVTNDYEEISVIPNGYVDIQPNKFSSLFAFSCTFTAAPATETKTGLITARLDSYGFRAQKDVKVRYSPPTGTSGLVGNNIVSETP
ncbi:MAG: hypothetical protein HY365_03475 [Candidatus Aenigmarchaeota archaeon]|nr:hypothetical protein [Candidatus Aenigmarchaeota archaeon]